MKNKKDLGNLAKSNLSEREFHARMKALIEEAGLADGEVFMAAYRAAEHYRNELEAEAAHRFFSACQYAAQDAQYHSTYYTLPDEMEKVEKAIYEARRLLRRMDNSYIKDNRELVDDMAAAVVSDRPPKDRILLDHLPEIGKMTGDLAPGYYIFSGAPNAGKSAIVQNIVLDALRSNGDSVRSVIYSFDDSTDMTIKRLVASMTAHRSFMAGSGMNDGTKIYLVGKNAPATAFTATRSEYLFSAFQRVSDWTGNGTLRVMDRRDVATMTELEYSVKEQVRSARREGKKIIVVVDACLKIDCSATGLHGIEMDDWRADELDKIAANNNIPFLTTHELRKFPANETQQAKPTIEDTKGSGRYGYNAKFGALIYPVNREKFKSGDDLSIRCYVDKNKLTEHGGLVTLLFQKAYCYLYQQAQEEAKHDDGHD